MLMSHNTSDQEIDFFLLFLHNSIEGDRKYDAIVLPVLHDAKELATGRPANELDNTSLNLKIMIGHFAHDWLMKVNIEKPSIQELQQLQEIINGNKNYAII